MRGARRVPQGGRRVDEDRGYSVQDNDIEVVVSPTGRQRLTTKPNTNNNNYQRRDLDDGDYNASKYKIYEHPQYTTNTYDEQEEDESDSQQSDQEQELADVAPQDLARYVELMKRKRDAQMVEMVRAQKELEELRNKRKELEELERMQKGLAQLKTARDNLTNLKELSERVSKLKSTHEQLSQQKARLERLTQVPVANLELIDDEEEEIDEGYVPMKPEGKIHANGGEDESASGSVVEFSENSEDYEEDNGEEETEYPEVRSPFRQPEDPENRARLRKFVSDLDTQLNSLDSVQDRVSFLQHLLAETENSISSVKRTETPTKTGATNPEYQKWKSGNASPQRKIEQVQRTPTSSPPPSAKRGSYPSPSSSRTHSNTSYINDLFRGKGDVSSMSLDLSNLQPSLSDTQDEDEWDEDNEDYDSSTYKSFDDELGSIEGRSSTQSETQSKNEQLRQQILLQQQLQQRKEQLQQQQQLLQEQKQQLIEQHRKQELMFKQQQLAQHQRQVQDLMRAQQQLQAQRQLQQSHTPPPPLLTQQAHLQAKAAAQREASQREQAAQSQIVLQTQQQQLLKSRQQELQKHQQELLAQLQQQQELQMQLQHQLQQKTQTRDNLDQYMAWREKTLAAAKPTARVPPPPPSRAAAPRPAPAKVAYSKVTEVDDAVLEEIAYFLQTHEDADSKYLLPVLREFRDLRGQALRTACHNALVAVRNGNNANDKPNKTPLSAMKTPSNTRPTNAAEFVRQVNQSASKNKPAAKTPGRLQNYFIDNLHYESPNKDSSEEEILRKSKVRGPLREVARADEDSLSSIPSNYDDSQDEEDEDDIEEEEEDDDGDDDDDDEEEEDDEEDDDEEGSFIALKKNMGKTEKSPAKTEEHSEAEMKQMASLAKEYTEEIINNEIIIKELDLHIMAMMEEGGEQTFSQNKIASLAEYVASLKVDLHLAKTVYERMIQFLDSDVLTSKNALVQAVSDLLYDEMVFHKVMQKVDKSYLDEIKELQATRGDLQTEEERLMKQREQDLLRLQRERWARFAKNNEAAEQSPDNMSRATTRGSIVDDLDDDFDSETNSVNDGGSEQEQWSVNGEYENRIGVDDLPSQPFSIPRKSPLANGTHTPSPVPPIPATANGNGHFTVPPKEEWREQFIREQDPIANIGKNSEYAGSEDLDAPLPASESTAQDTDETQPEQPETTTTTTTTTSTETASDAATTPATTDTTEEKTNTTTSTSTSTQDEAKESSEEPKADSTA